MPFSILSWNIEHFKGRGSRLSRVASHIRSQRPEIFCLLEVEGADVPGLMRDEFPRFDFGVTDGPQTQELLVGWKRGAFNQVSFNQKRGFKVGNPALRPGALLTVRRGRKSFDILFLHTDSGIEAKDFGNRFEMFEKVWKLKGALDKREGGDDRARLIVMGDHNLMGIRFPKNRVSDRLLTGAEEILGVEELASDEGMEILKKSEDLTFNNGRLTGDLDHVLATTNVNFARLGRRQIDGRQSNFHVNVRGWNQLSGARRRAFIDKLSDHSSLLVTVR